MTLAHSAWPLRLVTLLGLMVLTAPAAPTHAHTHTLTHALAPSLPHPHTPTPALLFVTDGGRPDLFRQFAARGLLPTYARLEREGAMGANGLLAQLPYDATNDGQTNYDRAAVQQGAATVIDLRVGEWSKVRLKLAGGQEQGKTAGLYSKLMALEPDLRRVKFFVSAVSRVTAHPPALEDCLADHFPTRTGVAGALAWERLVDEATFAEGAALTIPFNLQALPYLLGEYAPDTHLALVGYLNTDIIQHATLALLTRGAPVYYDDDADRDGVSDGRLEERQANLEDTYIGADKTLAAAWSAMPPDTVVLAASAHGFAPTWPAPAFAARSPAASRPLTSRPPWRIYWASPPRRSPRAACCASYSPVPARAPGG